MPKIKVIIPRVIISTIVCAALLGKFWLREPKQAELPRGES